MNEKEHGVHQSHCCAKHGCKYGDENCPVLEGLILQDHPCLDCERGSFTKKIKSIHVNGYGTLTSMQNSNGEYVANVVFDECLDKYLFLDDVGRIDMEINKDYVVWVSYYYE